ncbi:uncharacterized protein LOC113075715 [Carassius auratus]|uniref:Uncharacterized protein LOC113075715 n=1 Tax=Carassius auratus TaxID=7957 RepID=A0A6P6N572_CARAU|nr:uncharacterized protein LOC113075715 [Carassius auratus]
MTLFVKLKTRGLIVVFMVMTICRFSSSPPLQKRSSNCRCSLSCAELPEISKNDRIEVHVQDQSRVIYNKEQEVSSLFNEGHCSVVVPECLQEDKKFELRIYGQRKQPIYEKMDLKPVCKTEEPPEKNNKLTDGEDKPDPVPSEIKVSSGAERISFNTFLNLLIMVFFFFLFPAKELVPFFDIERTTLHWNEIIVLDQTKR